MAVELTQSLIQKLRLAGISTFQQPGVSLPDETLLEPPCSLKWMGIQHSLHMGAFSYAVSGFYFGCRIGRYCSIAEQVQIGRHPHPMHWFSSSPFFYMPYKDVVDQELPAGIDMTPHKDFARKTPPVIAKLTHIGSDVWIGHGAFILPGMSIGHGAAVAAMSVVTKDVPPYAVVAGVPAKVIRYRFPEVQVERLLASRWWEYAPWSLKGSKVDDIPAFLDFVAGLRDAKAVPYIVDQVNLAVIAGDARKP